MLPKIVKQKEADGEKDQPIRSKENFLVFGSPEIREEEIQEVVASLQSGWLGTGPKVAEFEKLVRRYKGAPYVAAVNSCTAALHLSLLTAGLELGDEVITTPLTFCATVNAIIHARAVPVLADIDPQTLTIDPCTIQKKIGPKTKAILPVHFAGRPCEMDAIMHLAREYNLKVIEDCAHAMETEYHGKKAGTFGDFGCLSFYVTKNITTGEGGMVLAQRQGDIEKIKMMALHGLTKDAWERFRDEGYKHYYVAECGYKYNMMDLQAAIGIHQLKRIESSWEKRQQIWFQYQEAFRNLPLLLPENPAPRTRHAYHLYTVRIHEKEAGLSRDNFLEAMTNQGIGVGVHYLSIPEHPYYQKTFGWRPEDYPHAHAAGRELVSLPLSPKLTPEDVHDVVRAVKKVLKR